MRCPAKLNLTLAVGLPDHSPQGRGRHAVVSHMAAINFFDTLDLQPLASKKTSRWHIAFADDAPLPQPVDWPLEKDLAFRAHAAVEQHLGQPFPLDVQLTKRIPAGAGLGGGSADAAGMLFSLGELLGDHLDPNTQLHIARALGTDVAFALLALQGSPTALATGLGDQLQPTPPTPNTTKPPPKNPQTPQFPPPRPRPRSKVEKQINVLRLQSLKKC